MRTPTDPSDKRSWRRSARATRAKLDLGTWSRQLVEALRAWPIYGGAGTVATYLAFGDEANLGPLLGDGKRFVAPRTGPPGTILTFHLVPGKLVLHPYGMQEPSADAPRVPNDQIDLALIPGLAFDRYGTRLGRGGGHYDAWAKRLTPGTPLVGIAHPDLIAAELPREVHDVQLTHLALPGGVQAVTASRVGDS